MALGSAFGRVRVLGARGPTVVDATGPYADGGIGRDAVEFRITL